MNAHLICLNQNYITVFFYRLEFLKRNIERADGTALIEPSCAKDLLGTISEALRHSETASISVHCEPGKTTSFTHLSLSVLIESYFDNQVKSVFTGNVKMNNLEKKVFKHFYL